MAFEIRYYNDDIEFVTEFPCLLGHPVLKRDMKVVTELNKI